MLSVLVDNLWEIKESHATNSKIYKILDKCLKHEVDKTFGNHGCQEFNFQSIGKIILPYFSMGAINSTHLFGLDELIIFSFYKKNIDKYRKVSDLGANIGIHTIFLSKLGYEVHCYEPDPIHFKQLQNNLNINNICQIKTKIVNKAVSVTSSELEFIRVIGNTTGSHLVGSKENVYGKTEKIRVECESFNKICENSDLIKMDVEGHEADLILNTSKAIWLGTDALVEIGSEKNANKIFDFLTKIDVNVFSQKIGWQKVNKLSDMPTSHKEGSAFISTKDVMPW